MKLLPSFKSFLGFGWYPAELTDKSLHGDYIGIDPITASRGGSLAESQTEFSLSEKAVAVSTVIEEKEFQVKYDSSWIFHLTGWDVDECLAVRQSATSGLAEFILCFTHPWRRNRNCNALMMLGEGMPAVLGIFAKKAGCSDIESFLKKTYDQCYQPKAETREVSYLTPIDFVEAEKIMFSGNTWDVIDLLKKAAHNLWTGTEQEISDRINLVRMGLEHKNPEVQKQALDTFVLGGRVTSGVDIVVKLLEQSKSFVYSVCAKALDAAVCLLYEAHMANKNLADLHMDFGTDDVKKIHEKTNGLLSPEQYKLFVKVVDQSKVCSERRWTLEHQKSLRSAMSAFLSNPDVDFEILCGNVKKNTERALSEYYLPQLDSH